MGNINLNNQKQRNYSLDFLKFISSFLIVCIHFKFFGTTGEFVTVIARFAVPVFFMISGYYSYGADAEKIKYKIINIAKIYFLSVVFYFCFNILVMMLDGQYKEAIWYVSTYFRIQYTLKIVLFNESITAMHLWFMGALIYSYIIRYLVIKANIKDSIVLIISCLLLVLNIVLGIGLPVFGIETPVVLLKNYMLRNFLFMGFPFLTIGQFINKNEEHILRVVSGKLVALLIILSVVDSILVYRVDWTKDLYIGAVLLAITLFVVALKMNNKKYHPSMIAVFNTTTFVYLSHIMIGEIFALVGFEGVHFYMYIKPVIIFVVSIGIALLANKLIFSKKSL